jgi:hypothetical protein
MSVSGVTSRLGRIAAVRHVRLTRAAEDARAASEAARNAAAQAAAARDKAVSVLDDARDMFGAAPGCPQARIWVDIASARQRARASDADVADSDAAIADENRCEALLAVVRHDRRRDAIATHGRALARAEQRALENRIDGEENMS